MFVLCTSGVLLAPARTGSQHLALILLPFAQNPWSATSGEFSFQHLLLALTQLMLMSRAEVPGSRGSAGALPPHPGAEALLARAPVWTRYLWVYVHRANPLPGLRQFFSGRLPICRVRSPGPAAGEVLWQSSLHRANGTGWQEAPQRCGCILSLWAAALLTPGSASLPQPAAPPASQVRMRTGDDRGDSKGSSCP